MNRKFIFAAFIAVPLFFACSEVGSDGADGSSCIVQTRSDDGFDVLCGVGEEKTKLGEIHNGAKGDKGDSGNDGVGCALTDNGTAFTLTCGATEVSWAKILWCGEVQYNPATTTKYCSAANKIEDLFIDERDGQIYKTATIGAQVWMAENLNYNASGSKCYDNSTTNCTTYGRLYDWATAMDIAATYNTNSYTAGANHQGVCPSGWHLPSDAEWTMLENYVGGSSSAGKKLKASSGNGTDNYGFSALPGGCGHSGCNFYDVGY